MSYLSRESVLALGFKSVGDSVLISDKCSIYNAKNISIGGYVRIDDFSLLSAGEGGIEIGNHVHISCFSCILGKGKITIGDYCAISIGARVLSSTDNFYGEGLHGFVDESIKEAIHGDVKIGNHCVVGCNSILLPYSNLQDNVAIAALSLVKSLVPSNLIVGGIPAKQYLGGRKPIE